MVLLALRLVLAGLAAASTNAASGRVVVGWFPAGRRGLAMGIRQMAQPVGVGVAATTMAVVADRHGPYAAVWVPVVACALAAVLVALVVHRPAAAGRRADRGAQPLPRRLLPAPHPRGLGAAGDPAVHGVDLRPGLADPGPRLVAGRGRRPGRRRPVGRARWAGSLPASCPTWSAVGCGRCAGWRSRRRPRCCCSARPLGSTWPLPFPSSCVATVVTVADNGLAFTAVAERAGPFWSGRALGLQNTAQFLAAAAVPPLAGLTVT